MEYLRLIVSLEVCGLRELARAARVTPTAATDAVRSLARKGLVVREPGTARTLRATALGVSAQEPVVIGGEVYEPVWWRT